MVTSNFKMIDKSRHLPTLELFVPILNEEDELEGNIIRLLNYFKTLFDNSISPLSKVVVVDNGSTDNSVAIMLKLLSVHPSLGLVTTSTRGKGHAVKIGFLQSEADLVGFVDLDLSPDITRIASFVDEIVYNSYDFVIASRYMPGSVVSRGWLRSFTSRVYRIIFKYYLGLRVSDANCGLKIGKRKELNLAFSKVESKGWFFDVELLHYVMKNRLAVKEMPITWVDDDDSRVKIARATLETLDLIIKFKKRITK